MTFLLVCSLVAAGVVATVLLSRRYPRIKCEIGGHEPKCGIEDHGVIRFTCAHCGKECSE